MNNFTFEYRDIVIIQLRCIRYQVRVNIQYSEHNIKSIPDPRLCSRSVVCVTILKSIRIDSDHNISLTINTSVHKWSIDIRIPLDQETIHWSDKHAKF